MRTITLTLIAFAALACGPPRANVPSAGMRSDEVKKRLDVLVAMQRSKTEWLEKDACAVDNAPGESRDPRGGPEDCAGDPSLCLTDCDSGYGDACLALGLLIQENGEIDNIVSEALFKKACRLGIASGCTNAAATKMHIEDDKADACVARSFDYACKQADPWGCTMHGRILFEQGHLVPARVALDRACEVSNDKNGEACTNAKTIKAEVVSAEKR